MKTETVVANLVLTLFAVAFICAMISEHFNLGYLPWNKFPGGMLGFLGLWGIIHLVRMTILLIEIRDRIK